MTLNKKTNLPSLPADKNYKVVMDNNIYSKPANKYVDELKF
jgi:hypothetical protein